MYVNELMLDNAGPILIRPYTPFLDRNLGRLSCVRSHSHCEKVFKKNIPALLLPEAVKKVILLHMNHIVCRSFQI